MRTPTRLQKPRTSELKEFKAPVGGWIANRNLADPASNGLPQGAAILDNYIPRSTSAVLRRGSETYATLGILSKPVTVQFSYSVGNVQKHFAATEDGIWDITTVSSAFNYTLGTDEGDTIVTENGDTIGQDSTAGLEVWTGTTGGDWIVVQFTTEGGTFLIGVNGTDTGFIYDGTAFYPNVDGGVWALAYDGGSADFTIGDTVTGGTSGATGVIWGIVEGSPGEGALILTDVTGDFQDNETLTDEHTGEADASSTQTSLVPGVTGIATSSLCFVWAYKNRLFFIEKESLSGWYLDIDSIGGTLTEFPMGAVFQRGGSLLFGAAWSLDSGSQGGLSEQCIFVTTEGEVAVYQGSNPSEANDWMKVGIYRVGKPLGKRSFIRAGGDIVDSTSIGLIPLSQAIQRDFAALSPAAVSYPIEEAWVSAVRLNPGDWIAEVWPEQQMVVIAPPTVAGTTPFVFVANARTGAWSRFTNWIVTSLLVFQGQLYFGTDDGRVVKGNVTGSDDGATYTGVYMPLFEDLGTPASMKIGCMARAVSRATSEPVPLISFHGDFDMTLPAPPDAPVASGAGNEWGAGIWGQSQWGGRQQSVVSQAWQSIGGTGYAISLSYQVTSGDIVPLDDEIIRMEATIQTAEVVT